MVSIMKRMRKMKTIFQIRFGPGAAIFPSSSPISRLHLTYTQKAASQHGQLGARRFWRLCLPRIKFYNPSVGITVKHIEEQTGPGLLSVYFAKPDASNPASSPASEGKSENNASDNKDSYAPAPTESERVETISVRDRNESEIWAELRSLTKAKDVEPAETEAKEMEDLERQERENDVVRRRVASVMQAKKDQERMLKEAKEDVQKLRGE